MNYSIEKECGSYLESFVGVSIEALDDYIKSEKKEKFFKTLDYYNIQKADIISILRSVYVAKENRNNGTAKEMMNLYLKENKSQYQVLVTDKTSDTESKKIEKFYEKFGFKVSLKSSSYSVMIKRLW